jgi:hypothetical protein
VLLDHLQKVLRHAATGGGLPDCNYCQERMRAVKADSDSESDMNITDITGMNWCTRARE